MRQTFPCDQCGECCRHVSGVLPNVDGVCVHLKDNKCEIYATRPEICNVERMYEGVCGMMSWEEWVKMNQTACKRIKEGRDV